MNDLRDEIAREIVGWCIANGEEFLPNPLADRIVALLNRRADAALAPQAGGREQTPPEAQKGPLGIPIEASDSLAPDEVRFVDHTGIKARIVNLAEPPEAQGREKHHWGTAADVYGY